MFGRRHHGAALASTRQTGQAPVLATLANGERAIVTGVVGGGHLQKRLENMGLRPGKEVTKLGAMPAAGPVTVECGGFCVALGHGIAQRVTVKPIDPSSAATRVRGEETA